jgi:hypothetical protein
MSISGTTRPTASNCWMTSPERSFATWLCQKPPHRPPSCGRFTHTATTPSRSRRGSRSPRRKRVAAGLPCSTSSPACRGLPVCNAKVAAIFRVVEMTKSTLLMDEADTYFHDNDELRGILNAGHRNGGYVPGARVMIWNRGCFQLAAGRDCGDRKATRHTQ